MLQCNESPLRVYILVQAASCVTDRPTVLGGATLDLPKIRKNPLIEIIPINTGTSCAWRVWDPHVLTFHVLTLCP